MWSKYVTRRLATQVAQAWNFGWGKAMHNVYGVSVNDTLVFRDSKKTDYYVDQKQHEKYVAGLYKLLDDNKFIKVFHRDAQDDLEKILKNTQKRFNQDFSKLPDKELIRLYENFILPNQTQFYIRMWTVFNIGEPLANVVKGQLKKYIIGEKKITEYLLNLSSPIKPNDVINERIDILKLTLVKDRLNQRKVQERINKHTQKYQHIPMFDFDHTPYTQNYFQNELRLIKNPKEELEELKELFNERQKEFEGIIKILKPDKKFLNLLEFLKDNVFLRDYRDMLRQKLNVELRKFYQEVARRLDISIEQVAILTNNEVIKYLSVNKKFPKKEINERVKLYLLIQNGSKVEMYSGRKALSKAKIELKISKLKQVKEVRGIVGSKGEAKGRVVIIYTNKDLSKVKKGDVMVATMTRQDFVPAMRKAVAVVTDEGSVTAHAAIIARELKIPCVVATKFATQIFKDGDIVEVDAIHGLIRKL